MNILFRKLITFCERKKDTRGQGRPGVKLSFRGFYLFSCVKFSASSLLYRKGRHYGMAAAHMDLEFVWIRGRSFFIISSQIFVATVTLVCGSGLLVFYEEPGLS